jgi:RNA-directed DNA polymerase
MKDRAMQAVYAMALDPIAETTGDVNSYGFRKSRCTADAREQCFSNLAKASSAEWILEGDIKGCFDNISHQWLINNVPTDKVMLKKWLKAGFIYNKELFPTEAGTPQGGIISPLLANLTLDGLVEELRKTYWINKKGNVDSSIRAKSKVNFVRYADDFIITGKTPAILEEVKTLVENFLRLRGLELEPNKTKITHITDGFDFLGWNFRKYKGKLLTSKDNISNFLTNIRESITGNPMAKQENLIQLLNPKIRGWANYHCGAVAKETFSKVNHEIWQSIWRWAIRRHPNKGKKWVKDRYFQRQDTRDWVFTTKQEGTKLINAADTPIVRHIKIKAEANPYDPEQEQYFEKRIQMQMKSSLKGNAKLLGIWTRQAGMCPNCSQWITKETEWHVHHVIPISEGGKDTMGNLRMLHPNCHRQLHNRVISNVDGSDNELIKA